jgi:hypothetical protein
MTKEFSKCARTTTNHNKCKHLSFKSKHKTKEFKTRPQSMQKNNWCQIANLILTLNHSFDHNLSLNIQMKNVNPFSIFRFQDLLNGFLKTQFAHFVLFAFLFQKFKTLWNFRFPKVKVGRPFGGVGFHFFTLVKMCLSCITLSRPTTFLCF